MSDRRKTHFDSSAQTKYFFFNWAIYFIAIIASTVYCYGRLNYVRSYAQTDKQSTPISK